MGCLCLSINSHKIILYNNILNYYYTIINFRDHYFENHDIADASKKPQELQVRLEKTLAEFDKFEASSVIKDRSSFLYLKGRLLHVNGEFNSEAEFCLSKSVKLNPNLVEAWNELGEAYMRKHDWSTARTCFEVNAFM